MKSTSDSHQAFQNEIPQNLGFLQEQKRDCAQWYNPKHPEHGYLLFYERPGLYALAVADHAVPSSFSLYFSCEKGQLLLGSFYDGQTRFSVEGISTYSSASASCLVWEEHPRAGSSGMPGSTSGALSSLFFPPI